MTRPIPRWLVDEVRLPFAAHRLGRGRGRWTVDRETAPVWPSRPARRQHLPRTLRAQHDYPRATGALGRPHLETARVVPLPRLFPRHRTVSNGRAVEDVAWWARTEASRRVWRAICRRDRLIFGGAWS